MQEQSVIIIGGGISGISAAMELANQGYKIFFIESTKKIGGRLSSFKDTKTFEIIDNGQHAFMGAYHIFFDILAELETIDQLYTQKALKINFTRQDTSSICLDATRLPGKLGMIYGFFALNGISLLSKFYCLKLLLTIQLNAYDDVNLSVKDFLVKYKQTPEMIHFFWEPLVLAVVNASIDHAAASLLVEVLKRAFLSDVKNSQMIFPKVSYSELFKNFSSCIKDRGGEVLLHTKALCVQQKDGRILLKTNQGIIESDALISAMPPLALKSLLSKSTLGIDIPLLKSPEHSTIVSVYLWFDTKFEGEPFSALLDSVTHWIFDRRQICDCDPDIVSKYPGHLACTVSAAQDIQDMSAEAIACLCFNEIRMAYPHMIDAKLLHFRVIKDKRATILIDPATEAMRPCSTTSVDNIFLAGDWVDTKLPATIEGAALSGKNAAIETMKYLRKN